MDKNIHSNDGASMGNELDALPPRWTAGFGQADQESSEFYLLERQIGRSVEVVSFALKTGTKRAFAMRLFDEIRFKPEVGISLFSRMVVVTIVGQNLDKLYQMLCQKRVKEVREFGEIAEDETVLVIEKITIHSDYDEH